ncbi:MAG: PepSY domain-containing protein [Oscillospiraceae bacterium]|nr:PepSY domain-containing protein [Oscillospiraceae bacterium]MCL2279702.1 PepSY domain-containing protein [Oscillospiraceae bacterium]
MKKAVIVLSVVAGVAVISLVAVIAFTLGARSLPTPPQMVVQDQSNQSSGEPAAPVAPVAPQDNDSQSSDEAGNQVSEAQSGGRGSRPVNPAISLQRAIEIAEEDLAERGINATFHTDSGMDWERRQWVWELEFRVADAQRGRHVIEYYINVDTGEIVKFEWDD